MGENQHVGNGGRITAIAGKDFMGFGETICVEHQPDDDLFAVGAGVARITALGVGIRQA
jgi:hypothetical protein